MRMCPECGKREIGPRAAMCGPCGRKAVRAYYFSKGICPECKKNELYNGERKCIECRAAESERRITRYHANTEKMRHEQHESYKRRYARRKEAGQCVKCGRKTKNNHAYCGICLARRRNKQSSEILRSERVSNGLCYFCGEPLDRDGRSCTKCAERCTETIAKYRPVKSKTWDRANAAIFNSRSAERKKDDSR